MINFSLIIVAAGDGTRLGSAVPKQFLKLAGKSMLSRSIAAFDGCNMKHCVLVLAAEHRMYLQSSSLLTELPDLEILLVDGGATRQQSVFNGLKALPKLADDNLVLIHDAARPLICEKDIQSLVKAASQSGAATLAQKISDTLYSDTAKTTVDRSNLWAIQTPQAFHYALISKAHEFAMLHHQEATDDAGLVRALGHGVDLVATTKPNFKITVEEDLILAEAVLSSKLSHEVRTGSGFDVHAFDAVAQNIGSVRICGVDLPSPRRLLGHSDADVALHALTDAVLGAIGEGDIGLHFPPSDMAFKNMDSAIFLQKAMGLMKDKGGSLINADITLICEKPKIGLYRDLMRARVAEILQVPVQRVNIKATTTEKLGFAGREEGIAAQAIVSVSLPI